MSAREDKLIGLWSQRKDDSYVLRQIYEDRWIQNWQWYRNTKTTKRIKNQPWTSNVMIPDAFRIIETMLPSHIMGMFDNPNWFSVEAPTAPGQTYQRAVKALLHQGWRQNDAVAKTIEAVKYSMIVGHCTPKVVWSNGRPEFSVPDNFNIYQDPTGKEQWWIERIPTSMSMLKERNRAFRDANGFSLYKNLSKVEADQSFSRAASKSTGRFGQATDPGEYTLEHIVEGIPLDYRRDEDNVTLLECWGWVPPSVTAYAAEDEEGRPTNRPQMRHQIIAGESTIIYDEPMPPGPMPYWNVPCIPIPHSLYGESVLSYVGDLIDLRSQVENMRRDEVLLNIHGQYWKHARAGIKGGNMGRYPGGVTEVDPLNPDAKLSDVFGMIPRQPVLQEAYIESGQKEQQINAVSGSTEMFQGTGMGGRATATEASMVANIGTGRVRLAATWLNEVYKKTALKKMFQLYQNRMDQDTIVKLDDGLVGGINMQDLQYDVDIYVDSGKFGSMDQQQIQGLMQAMQLAASVQNGHAAIDIIKAIDEIAIRSGISTKVTRTEKEANEIIALEQQIQQAQAQAGAAQQGQPQ